MTFIGWVEGQFTTPAAVTLQATSNAGGPTLVTMTPGTYFHATFATAIAAALNAQRPVTAGAWTVTYSTTTGKYTIGVTNGVCSITWVDSTWEQIVGFNANIAGVASATGALQARGLWIPDCPPSAAIPDLAQAPRPTDRRSTCSPRGLVISHKSTSKYLHPDFRWSHVARERVWIAYETTTNMSWEKFLQDIAWSEGLSWFSGSAFVRIYDTSGLLVGRSGNGGAGVTGWTMRGPGIDGLQPKPVIAEWGGLWRIDGIDLETDG